MGQNNKHAEQSMSKMVSDGVSTRCVNLANLKVTAQYAPGQIDHIITPHTDRLALLRCTPSLKNSILLGYRSE